MLGRRARDGLGGPMARLFYLGLLGLALFVTYDYLAQNGRQSDMLLSKAGQYFVSFQSGVSTNVFQGLTTSAANAAGALAGAVSGN